MRNLKKLAAITVSVLASAVYSATAASGQLPVEGEHETVATLTQVVPSITINKKTPEELLESGELSPVMRNERFTIPGTNEAGEAVAVPAERKVLLGFLLRVASTRDPRQTVALDYKRTGQSAFEITVGEATFTDSFYPKDPREILMEMYAEGEEFKMPFVIENDSISSAPSIFMHDDRIQISAQEFQLTHGTVIASPFPLQFALKSNPFISQIAITGRPFYQEFAGIPACLNTTLLEMIGAPEELKIKASFVGALHKSAMEVLFHPSIMPGAAASAI